MTDENERIQKIINEINEEIIRLKIKRDIIYYTRSISNIGRMGNSNIKNIIKKEMRENEKKNE